MSDEGRVVADRYNQEVFLHIEHHVDGVRATAILGADALADLIDELLELQYQVECEDGKHGHD